MPPVSLLVTASSLSMLPAEFQSDGRLLDRNPDALCEIPDGGERIDLCSLLESSQKADEHREYLFAKFERQPS